MKWPGWMQYCLASVSAAGRFLFILTFVSALTEDDSLEAAPEPHQRLCLRNSECEVAAGEVCWWYYSGCREGQCMCDPRWSFKDPTMGCRTMKLGNEPCKTKDKCPDGMVCLGGRCLCITGTLTPDHTFCLKQNERLLGQICNDMTDICYQKSTHGYSTTEVLCNVMGFCSCREGYKEAGSSCVRWNIGERGCLKNYHCQGGALCIDGYCKCPTGYEPGARKSKCVRQGATFDLSISQQCDEINESRYCAKDYVCHRCAGQHNYTCVKFLETQHRRYVSSATRLSPSLLLSIIIASHILIYVTISNWKNR